MTLSVQDRRQNGKLVWLEQLDHEKLDNVFLTFYDVFDETGTYNTRQHHFVGFVGEGEVGCVMKKVTLGGHAANYSEGMLD
jgi:hypothetical protein